MGKVEDLQRLGATREQIIDIASRAPIIGDKAAALFPELSMWGIMEFADLDRIPPNFNWIEYLNANPDLDAAGIDTAEEANRHYAIFGYKENRPNAPQALETRTDRYQTLRTELENQYKALVKLAPAAAYRGRSGDLNAIFHQQASQLADAGVSHVGDLQVKDGRLINAKTGMPVTTSNLGGQVAVDRDTGVNKWGDIFSGVKGGANYGIQELPDGSVLLFPAWEKTKSPISQIGLSFLEPIIAPIATIAGTFIGGPVGAGVGNSIGQFLATGEVELEKALVAAATVYVGSEISAATGGSAESIGASVAPEASAATQAAIGEAAINAGVGAGIYAASGGDPLTGAILGAAGSVTSTTYAQTVGKSFAPTATAATQITIGNAVLNAGLSGVIASATGGDVAKSMLAGAAKGAAIANTKEIAEAVVGKENIAAVVNATNLTTAQVENIIATSVANGVIAEVANTGNFAETMLNSLVSNGVGTSVANGVVNNIKLDVAQEKAIFSATRNLASVATNASLEGKDVGLALEMAAPGAILSGYQEYDRQLAREEEAAQREKELGAVQQPPATGDAVEGGVPIEGEGAGEVSLGEPPLQVAGDELGLGTTLDILETLKREALSGIGEEVIRSEVVEDEGFTYEVKLVQGVRDDGSLYEYKIIVDQDGSVSYEWNPSFTESVASRERPDLRSSPPETAVPSDRVNLFGTTQEDLRPVAVPDEPPIVVGIDLRKYGDPSLGGGDALIRSTEGPTGFTETAGIFQFIGTEPTSGLQKYKVGNQSFTFIMLPNKQPALLNDVVDVVLIPKEEPSSDPTQPPKLTFDERPLEDFTPPPEDVPPPEPEDVPPPDPTKLPPGTAADRDEGASGTAGEKGAAGGLTGLEEQRRKERDETISRIIEEELSRLTSQLTQAESEAEQAAKNLQRAQEQQRKFTAPDFVAISGPDLASSLERETQFATDAAERAEDARLAAAAEVGDIGALQRGEQTLTDQQILSYLRTGQLPPAGGEGDGEPGTRGPGTGADEEGPGPGGLEEGDESGAGDRGVGPGAGQEGTEVGGGGEGEGGAGELRTPLSPSLIFSRSLPARPETTPFASRVTGEALEGILGEKEPLFGGDDDEQRAVWNRRSLKLLSRALGL